MEFRTVERPAVKRGPKFKWAELYAAVLKTCDTDTAVEIEFADLTAMNRIHSSITPFLKRHHPTLRAHRQVEGTVARFWVTTRDAGKTKRGSL